MVVCLYSWDAVDRNAAIAEVSERTSNSKINDIRRGKHVLVRKILFSERKVMQHVF